MKLAAMHPAAEQELKEVTDYYAPIDPDLADAFVDCFKSYTPHTRCISAAKAPHAGPI